jgi:hypothetical protein
LPKSLTYELGSTPPAAPGLYIHGRVARFSTVHEGNRPKIENIYQNGHKVYQMALHMYANTPPGNPGTYTIISIFSKGKLIVPSDISRISNAYSLRQGRRLPPT